MAFPPLLTRDQIRARLLLIFPEGTQRRPEVTGMIAASTVFTALYIGAIEGGDTWLGPKHVYRMTEEQAALGDEDARLAYIALIRRPGGVIHGVRWYADNTRESIRDDTLREGLVTLGAIVERLDVAVTANLPRYALSAGFAALFDPALQGEALETAIADWRETALTPGALARIALTRKGAAAGGDRLLITFPSGDTRRMRPGPSAIITKAVIEVFAPRFLAQPTVISTSDSGEKVYELDQARAQMIGLNIRADKDLPDIILVDLGPKDPLLVFVEVVHTDGPISERRKHVLGELVAEAGFLTEHVAFVTAYLDRGQAPFKKTVGSLAWGSYAWFVSEPENLLVFSEGPPRLGGA